MLRHRQVSADITAKITESAKAMTSPLVHCDVMPSSRITQSVSAKYGCFYIFARNFFILHFLTLQVVFILKTIELPTLW